MNLQWLDNAACHGACHYRGFVRTHPKFHRFLDEVEDLSGVGVRKALAVQLWTSIELESHARGNSPTLDAISVINHVPSFTRNTAVLPRETKKHTIFWFTLLPRIIRVNLRMMRRNC